MKINHCLILSAGLGTRMGEIGKKLPKVLWPLFDRRLLELQASYAKKLGAQNIYVNVHHLHESIVEFVEEKLPEVTVIYEDELLDVGGAIYNLAARSEVNYEGSLLILNGDQFLFFDDTVIERALNECYKVGVALLAIQVAADSGYNETVIENGRLVDINRNVTKDAPYETYSGMAMIDLSKLERKSGVQSFFSSVANFKEKSVAMLDAGEYEYWDFGTIPRYWSSCFELLKKRESNFYKFCVDSHAINDGDVHSEGYRSTNGINLTEKEFSSDEPYIVLESSETTSVKTTGIYWRDLFAKV